MRDALLKSELVGALEQLVDHGNQLLLHAAISILHVLDSYGAAAASVQLVHVLKPFT